MTEERKETMPDYNFGLPPGCRGSLSVGDGESWPGSRFNLTLTVNGDAWLSFIKNWNKHTTKDCLMADGSLGPDTLWVVCSDAIDTKVTTIEGHTATGKTIGARLLFPTIFAPVEPRSFRCVLGGEVVNIHLPDISEEGWKTVFDELTKRNAEAGLKLPEQILGKSTLPVPAGKVTVERIRVAGSLPQTLFRLASREGWLPRLREFQAVHTPLNWAVGLALFSLTSKRHPGAWQSVTVKGIIDRVWRLTERGARPRGELREDLLAEIVKIHTTFIHYVRREYKRYGRLYDRVAVLGSMNVIAQLELYYREKGTGKIVNADLATNHVQLVVKGRRVMKPNGEGLWAVPDGTLVKIAWRWAPSIADDLKALPAVTEKGAVMKNAAGKVIRTGYHIGPPEMILAALELLRREGEPTAQNLLIMLAHDITIPRRGDPRNVIEREAERLFALLGFDDDPKHPERREEMVTRAVFRLKQKDIGALLPGSDEKPRPPSEAELKSGRRKSPYYRLIRSEAYTPPIALVTKEEATAIAAEKAELAAPKAPKEADQPKADQAALPGLEVPPAPPIPSGAEIRAARKAAAVNLRAFSRSMKGPGIATWSLYETGKQIRIKSIPPEVWERVRAFIAKNKPPGG